MIDTNIFFNLKFIVINVATIALITLIGFNKPLCNVLNEHIICTLNAWSFSHFFYYVLLGYIFPGNFKALLLMGIAWEMFEFMLGMLDNCGENFKPIKQIGSRDGYWYGRWSDVVMNTLGYGVGYVLSDV